MKPAHVFGEMTHLPFLRKMKFLLASVVKRNPVLWSVFWTIGTHVDFLLPHDKSYYGFAHFSVPNGVFLDIGANNGITALGVHKVLPGYSVVSIEADPSHRPALERAKRRIPKFQYELIGASDVEKTLVLYTPKVKGRLIHALTSSNLDYVKAAVARDFGEREAGNAVYDQRDVRCLPLDRLALSPDIIKIDIEGYEFAALNGLSGTIDRQRPIIMVEFTPGFSENTIRFLTGKEYQLFTYDDVGQMFYSFHDDREAQAWSDSALQVNLFCVPAERLARISGLISHSSAPV